MSEQARLRNDEIAVLKRFYNVTSNRALIAAMDEKRRGQG